MQTLKKHGLERFDPSEDGARFDPRLHEATFQTKVDGRENGEVVMVQQKGFMLNGRVLRACFSPFTPFLFLLHDFAKKINQSGSSLSSVLSLSLQLDIMGKFH